MEQVPSKGKAGLPMARCVARRYAPGDPGCVQYLDCIFWRESIPMCPLYMKGHAERPGVSTCAHCKNYERSGRQVK